jgi:hypothetical protein
VLTGLLARHQRNAVESSTGPNSLHVSTAQCGVREGQRLIVQTRSVKSDDGRIGIFRARATRDGEALARDGEPYFAMNRLEEANRPERERALYEIQFGDGVWMLVREDDLVSGVIGPAS